jgi:hypothetical protein
VATIRPRAPKKEAEADDQPRPGTPAPELEDQVAADHPDDLRMSEIRRGSDKG